MLQYIDIDIIGVEAMTSTLYASKFIYYVENWLSRVAIFIKLSKISDRIKKYNWQNLRIIGNQTWVLSVVNPSL